MPKRTLQELRRDAEDQLNTTLHAHYNWVRYYRRIEHDPAVGIENVEIALKMIEELAPKAPKIDPNMHQKQ